MFIIEIIYITGALVAISACVPQLRQLYVSKASDELSLSTWMIWFLTQVTSLVYVATLANVLMIAVNTVWVGFYAVMVGLIVHYRHFRKSPVSVVADETPQA
ncbi:MAG TPA: PQ-loop domain-containing transporter [Candidatus Saccharibacteria bacterium]|nr:PQ-loop domain-containing transporter [Candidatus Saccharibacteria bacterium]HRK94117.1 PQ-loop domain-containing transporter [Candidatus Saccharibacteria bacterium]